MKKLKVINAFTKGKFLRAINTMIMQKFEKPDAKKYNSKKSDATLSSKISFKAIIQAAIPLIITVLQSINSQPASGCKTVIYKIKAHNFELAQSSEVCKNTQPKIEKVKSSTKSQK